MAACLTYQQVLATSLGGFPKNYIFSVGHEKGISCANSDRSDLIFFFSRIIDLKFLFVKAGHGTVTLQIREMKCRGICTDVQFICHMKATLLKNIPKIVRNFEY